MEEKVVELVGRGSVINVATPSSFWRTMMTTFANSIYNIDLAWAWSSPPPAGPPQLSLRTAGWPTPANSSDSCESCDSSDSGDSSDSEDSNSHPNYHWKLLDSQHLQTERREGKLLNINVIFLKILNETLLQFIEFSGILQNIRRVIQLSPY